MKLIDKLTEEASEEHYDEKCWDPQVCDYSAGFKAGFEAGKREALKIFEDLHACLSDNLGRLYDLGDEEVE